MITATPAMLAAIGVAYPSPGLYVEIGVTTTLRLHDRSAATRSWNSITWTRADVTLSGLTLDASAVQACALTIVDGDNSIAQQLRTDPAGRPVKVWFFDTAATATADPVQIFEGIIASIRGGDDRRLNLDCKSVTKNLPVGMLAHLIPPYMFTNKNQIAFGNGVLKFTRRTEYA